MQGARSQRSARVIRASVLVLGVAAACSVVDKSDYEFTDDPGDDSGGEGNGGTSGTAGSASGASGKGGTSGTSGKGGTGGTSGRGGTSGKGGKGGSAGTSGSSGEGGEGGTPTGTGGQGGEAGDTGGTCGDDTLDPGEDCDDGNHVTEPCPYGSTSTCPGCSDTCRRIRPPGCGDNVKNGLAPTSFVIEYLATSCGSGVSQSVPLYLNGVAIPGLPFGAGCACQPGSQNVIVADAAVLAAVRPQGNVLSLLSNGVSEYLAWAVVTIVFEDGRRISRTAYDYGPTGDAESKNPGQVGACTFPPGGDFFGYGISDGSPFGGFPIEHCDGAADCMGCAFPACVTLSSTASVAIPDYDTVSGMAGVANSYILVPQLGTIRDVDVTLDIAHSYDQDLAITLRSPNTELSLVNQRGGSGQNFTNTVLDSACTTPIGSGTAPFTGCFAPEASLNGFNSFTSSIGPWFLTIKDNASGDVGTLARWSLRICGTP